MEVSAFRGFSHFAESGRWGMPFFVTTAVDGHLGSFSLDLGGLKVGPFTSRGSSQDSGLLLSRKKEWRSDSCCQTKEP